MMRSAVFASMVAGGSAATPVTYATLHVGYWQDTSPYDSYKWNPVVDWSKANTVTDCAGHNCTGGLTRLPISGVCPPTPPTADDIVKYGVTTGEAQFMTPSEPEWMTQATYMYHFDAGFIEMGFGRWEKLGHGHYCPTEDKYFWFNNVTDSFMWYNDVNKRWVMGKPSVTWWWEIDASTPRTLEPTCPEAPESISVCIEGQIPITSEETGCPSCRPPTRTGGCTREKMGLCDISTLPDCLSGFRPMRDEVTCCETCKLPRCPLNDVPQPCTADAPVCESDEQTALAWDVVNCCFTCTRPDTTVVDVETKGCTPEEVEMCLAETPLCIDSAEPSQPEGYCCESCRRPGRQWGCDPVAVAKCQSETPPCEGAQLPTIIDGECCESCKVVVDTCTCAANEGCLPDGTCVTMEEVKLAIRAPGEVASLTDLTNEELTALLDEIVARFCDHTWEETLCAEQGTLSATLSVKSVTVKDGAVELSVSIPVVNRRRLLSTGLLTAALNDPEANAGYAPAIGPSPTAEDQEETNGATVFGPAFAALSVVFAAQ